MTLPTHNSWIDALPAPMRTAGPHSLGEGNLFLHLGEAWYPPAPSMLNCLTQIPGGIQYYPDNLSLALRESIAGYCGAPFTPEHVFVGNGSDHIIDLLVSIYGSAERPVVAPEPTFFAYEHAAIRHHIPFHKVGRRGADEGYAFDEAAFLKNLPATTGIIFLANPNNPTGDMLPLEMLERIAGSTSALVVVDECYFEFCGQTALSLIQTHPNVLVLRSLSKSFSMAGLRIGYALGHEAVIGLLNRADLTFSANIVAQHCAVAALASLDYYRPLFVETKRLRGEWAAGLQEAGLRVLTSYSNTLLVDYSGRHQGSIAPELRQEGIYVADFHSRAGISNAFRMSVAPAAALKRVLSAVKKLIAR